MKRVAACCALVALVAAAALPAAPAASRRRGPVCARSALDGSAIPPGSSVTVSPAPGTRVASPRTQISLLDAAPPAISGVSVAGSLTGTHTGRLLAFSQGDGASWVPDRPFAPGETVSASVTVAGSTSPARWAFTVARAAVLVPRHLPPAPPPPPPHVQSFHSRPDLRPPVVAIAAGARTPAPGLLFVAPYSGPGQAGPMIFDNHGQVVWFAPLPPTTQAADFRVQLFQGRPALTWWQDAKDAAGHRAYEGVVYDTSYRPLATVKAGNGLDADHHEFELGPSNTALIAVYAAVRCDLRAVGGPADGAVWDGIVQEIDIPTGLVRLEWHSLDHVALGESYASAVPTDAGNPFDYFHLNSINPNRDGSLMLSARHTWAVYDVDPRTGQVRWRLGGRRSSFAMGPGTETAWQHDARELPDGSISLFDNGAVPVVHSQSRGMVVRLDPGRHRAVLVRRLEHPSRLVSGSQGNLQALPGGDWLVGWGQLARLTEFSASGRLLFDARMPAIEQSYRDFRFPWDATPTDAPALAVVQTADRRASVYASWNGATRVASWQVLEGAAPGTLAPVAAAARAGFETRIGAPFGASLMAVRALDAAGRPLGTSRVLREG